MSLSFVVGAQQFSTVVFGETSLPMAHEEKVEMDQNFNRLMVSLPSDPILSDYIDQILAQELVYENQIRACWQEAEQNYLVLSEKSKCHETLSEHKLAIRNKLLRESHINDAKMLPLFKQLRLYLKDKNQSSDIAEVIEKHYEVTKRWLILYEMPSSM